MSEELENTITIEKETETSEVKPVLTTRVFTPRASPPPPDKSQYFTDPSISDLEFFSSGCYLMDCALGGGWPLGRMSNVVGDKSSGKTLIAIEACANFILKYPKGKIFYLETEAAFDESYAEALGMPVEKVEFVGEDFPDFTIESWFEHLEPLLEESVKNKAPMLYIVDSLDALSDRAELERKISEGSYGGSKPKKIGELFRRLVKKIEQSNMHIMIVSQIRDNIGVMFGEKHTRTGGKALDFYASQITWLAQIGKIEKTVRKIKRTVGVNIRMRVKKNKVGIPFREVEYPILFGYGIDDVTAMLEWLDQIDELGSIDFIDCKGRLSVPSMAVALKNLEGTEFEQTKSKLKDLVRKNWFEIEKSFIPVKKKY